MKEPPTRIFPSFCKVIAYTNPTNPVPTLKLVSTEPSTLSRINLFEATPLKVLNSPPTKTFPSACSPTKVGLSFGFIPILKLLSKSPFANNRMTLFTDTPL